MNMEDSPLSTTASVTGILTFVAAIIAFFYVHYEILSSAEEEIEAIRTSGGSSIEDMAKTVYSASNYAELSLISLADELYTVELKILSWLCDVLQIDLRQQQNESGSLQGKKLSSSSYPILVISRPIFEALIKMNDTYKSMHRQTENKIPRENPI
ncbi:hypothetical protein HD806DRAFT_25639 [Xylariaceae sp. AK1471]|nr:hypothetical protein HD806DRAFT_25639 [Xylariaceae sp. AK1471]